MGIVRQPQIMCIDWLNEGPLAAHVDAYKQYRTQHAYASNSFANAMAALPTSPSEFTGHENAAVPPVRLLDEVLADTVIM